MTHRVSRESGFTLVELLVAMVVTLLISGAVVGLITSGSNAFRREPELTERQQNIRVAMSLIEDDVVAAGAGMGMFTQAFTDGLDGQGSTVGLNNVQTDVLEVLTSTSPCMWIPATSAKPTVDPGTNTVKLAYDPGPAECYRNGQLVTILYKYGAKPAFASAFVVSNASPAPDLMTVGPQPERLQKYIASDEDLRCATPPSAGGCATAGNEDGPIGVVPFTGVRYEIANDAQGTPNLYRSEIAGLDPATGAAVAAPGPGGGWQLVARAIEDLQVQYMNGAGLPSRRWIDTPGAVTCTSGAGGTCSVPQQADVDRLVRQVRITLTARSNRLGLEGAQDDPSLGRRVRGQLIRVVSPRAVIMHLGAASPSPFML